MLDFHRDGQQVPIQANNEETGELVMKERRTWIVLMAITSSGFLLPVYGQQSINTAPAELQEITVTGIRASLELSLAKKRDADSVMEVVSADDIGKLPDKNVA